jgi:hypothetical protein
MGGRSTRPLSTRRAESDENRPAPPANFLRARKASLMVEAMFGGPATSGCGTCNYPILKRTPMVSLTQFTERERIPLTIVR